MRQRVKWGLVFACIVTTFVIVAVRQQDKPLTIVFVGYTNASYADRPLAVFMATNATSRTLRYASYVERKTAGGWPTYSGPVPHGEFGFRDVPAGEAFRLVEYPPSDNAPWRISVLYSVLDTKWGQQRWRIAEFLYDHDFPTLGRFFHEGVKGYFALGPEMHREESAK